MKRRFIAASLLMCLFAPLAAARADDPVPDLQTLRAHVREATAQPPNSRETTVTTISNNANSTTTRIVRGADWRSIVQYGPFHSESGFIKGEAWHQNDNGQTVYDEAVPPAQRAIDPTTTTVTRVHQPVDAYVLAQINTRGWGTKRYINPATWQLIRFENLGPNGDSVTIYDDFRADAGYVFAHHWSTVNDYSRTTSQTRVTAYDTSPVSDADIAMPNSRRHLVEFPAGSEAVDLPAQFGQDHVYVRIVINGRGLDFTLDTGAAGLYLDSTVAREIGLTSYGESSAVTAQRYTTARTIVPEMDVGALKMHDVAVQLIPDGTTEQFGVKSIGLLGFDFLAELGVTIDYEHKRVTVVPQPVYAAPAGKHTIALDVRIGAGSPYLNIAINGASSDQFLIDTGGAGAVMIFDAFARKHPEALIDKGGGDPSLRSERFLGIGGEIQTRPYQLASIRIGPVNLTDFVTYLVTSRNSYAGNTDGFIGPTFLRLFDVGLDYANSRVYLVPNANGRHAMHIKD